MRAKRPISPSPRDDDTQPRVYAFDGPPGSWHRRLARFLVEPWTELPPAVAFRARAVATMVLANLVTSVVATMVVMVSWSELAPGIGWVLGPAAVVNLGMYLLARTRHFRWPGFFLVLSVPAGIIPVVMLITDPATFAIAMCWLVVGIGVASFLLPGWASILVLALYLTIPAVMVRVTGQSPSVLVGLELFIFTASFFILFHSWVIRRSERAAEEQRVVRRENVLAREKAEAALNSREEQLRITLDSIGDGVIATDPDGRIADLNATAAVLAGVRAADALGQPVDQVLQLLDPDTGAPTTFAELWQQSSASVVALLAQGEGSSTCRVEITRAPLRDAGGARVGAVFALRDHTERFALEEKLREAQRLEAVGRLAGGVAHDFNNLLFSISSLTELMEMSASEDFPFHQELRDILEAVDRGSGLTARLLAFSSRQVLRLEPLDLGVVIGEMAKMLRRVVGEEVELQVRTTEELALVQADRSQVEQILLSLALNAREAMPDGGLLTIETNNLVLEAADVESVPDLTPGRYVLLEVADSGHGMSEEVRELIFEPFFTTKDRGRGSGLGLSMVYGLVQQHGGHIHVHNAADRGAVFKVYLPEAAPEPEAQNVTPVAALEQPLPGAGETVLLAEDDEMPRRLTARALSQLGYRVIPANDGVHALALAREHEGCIHLLLTDVAMPRLVGPDLYRKLVEERPELRVVYLSGHGESTVASHGALEGGGHFLRKPVSLRKLARKLRQVLAPTTRSGVG